MDWKKYGLCTCGFATEAPFGDLFHIHMEVCPACGTEKKEWQIVTGRFFKKPSKLFKPSTWHQWEFQKKEGHQYETETQG